MKTPLIFFIAIIAIIFWTCEKTIDSGYFDTSLFTANFTNDWLCPDCGEGIIIISDSEGNIIADTTWTGNANFKLEDLEDLTVFPGRINVTTVYSTDSKYVYITTNLDVPVGSSWTWKKSPSPDYDNLITAEFDFQNIPQNESFSISSLWTSRSSSYPLYSPYLFSFYLEPMDLYLKLNFTDSDPKYLWINNIMSGYNLVDLSFMNNTDSKTIDLNGNSTGFRKYLYGYPKDLGRNSGSYRLDYAYSYDSIVSELTLNYPQSTFSDYRTSFYFYDDNNLDEFWYQSVYGDIPNSFTKIDADFNFISTSQNDFQISTTNTNFDEIRSSWTYRVADNYVSWNIYGPPDHSQYSLPELSNSVYEKYPYFDTISFELNFTDLIDYPELSSYEKVLDAVFMPTEYLYDIVNEFRSRIKYFDPEGDLKGKSKSSSFIELEDFYEMPY